MATQVQRRRGTTAEHASFTGAEGELTVDTTKDTVVVHDGTTAGGQPLAREDLDNVTSADVTAKVSAASTSAAGKVQLEDSTTSTSTTTAATANAVKTTKDVADAALPKAGGTVTGALEIGTTGSLVFEGSTADGFETTLGVVDPTADRTITLPNVTGTVITTGDTGTVTSTMIADGTIVNADISATAEIAVSKLADGAARQLLQTDAAGTGVEWTDNIDVPGTLDVTGAATFDNNVTVQGDLTVNGTTTTIDTQNLVVEDKNVVIGNVTSPTDVTADGGGITLKGTTDKTISWSDTTNAWTSSEPLDLPAGAEATPSLFFGGDVNSGLYSPGADQVAISTGGSERLRITSDGKVGIGTASPGSILELKAATPVLSINQTTANSNQGISFLNNGTEYGRILNNAATGILDIRNGLAASAGYSIRFSTDGSPAMTIDSSQNVGIGTTSPSGVFEVIDGDNELRFATVADAELRIRSETGGLSRVVFGDQDDGARGSIQYNSSDDSLQLRGYNNTERARLDSSGRLLVGTSTSTTVDSGAAAKVQTDGYYGAAFLNKTADSFGPYVYFAKSRGGTTIVQNGDTLGGIAFNGCDGTDFETFGASIAAQVDGTPAENSMPGRLVFSTTPSGSATPVERLRITSDGKLGLGATNPDSPLHIVNNGAGTADGIELSNFTGDSSYIKSVRSLTLAADFDANSNAAQSYISFETDANERARIDASGRLLVGTSTARAVAALTSGLQVESPGGSGAALSITRNSNSINGSFLALGKSRGTANGDSTIVQSGDTLGEIRFAGADGVDLNSIAATISVEVAGTPGADDMPGRLVFSTTADGTSSPTERMRIGQDGTVSIGTAATNAGRLLVQETSAVAATFNRNTTDGALIELRRSNVAVGSISVTASATAYNSFSDYRLKENVVPLTDAADRVNQLQVHRFNFIADPDRTVDGFIAHEAQAVVPECVTGEKDAVDENGKPQYQGIDQSKLVPLLTAALQEALAKIETLEARLDAAGL